MSSIILIIYHTMLDLLLRSPSVLPRAVPRIFAPSFSTSSTRRIRGYSETFISKGLSHKLNEQDFIRSTIFNESGEIIVHGKDIRRTQFMKTHNLVSRDFRKLNRHQHSVGNLKPDIVPSIVTRSDCILLNFLNIRALIKHDKVVLFDSSSSVPGGARLNESHSHAIFVKELSKRLRSTGTDDEPYEFRALESILVYVMSNLTTEMNVHKTVLRNVLYGLDESIDRVKLRYLLIQSKKISQFHQKAALIRDLLDGLLEQDDVLNSLYLTDKNNGILHHGSDHAEIEMLLESYYKTSDEIVQTVENLKSQIKTTEEIINVVLDSNRNELMLLSLKFSTGLLSMGIAMYVAALYGMNLENFIEELDYGFESIILVGSILMFVLLGFSMNRLKKVGKMTMTGAYREGSLGRKRFH